MIKRRKIQILFLGVFGAGVIFGLLIEKVGPKNIFKLIEGRFSTNTQATHQEMSLSGIPKKHQGNLKLFILAGQSNMSGMGELPKSDIETNSQIYVFGNDYHWKLAQEPVDDPRNQVDSVSVDNPAGFSPASSFATTILAQQTTWAIGLIPCAKGGSLIYEWRRSLDDNTLYGSCLKRVRAASVMGEVAGVLFFQGEIDAVNPKEQPRRTFSPHQWANEFMVLMHSWRRDLGLSKLPIVFAQIGTNTEPHRFINWQVVKAQQQKVQIPFSAMITTDDLALKDYVHFTTDSYKVIGQRFAKAYLNLQLAMESSSQK